ncbi:MAG: lysophospholipid acyltransferase family protein, partial [Bacteroidales bacterium]
MQLLYLFSDILAWVLKDVLKYRKEVVLRNLRNSFPDKTEAEIQSLSTKFYQHLSDIFMEAFKMLSLSKKQVLERYHCKNPELLNSYYAKGQSVILISAHYNNWEYMVLSLDLQFQAHGVGVGKPLSNKSFGDVLTRYRTRYGTEVIDAHTIRQKFEQYQNEHIYCVYMMLNDQSPGNPSKCYWTQFLHQDTGVVFGPEYYAKKYNDPVFFYAVNKVKRGYYEFEIFPISADPIHEPQGAIIEKSTQMLEKL